MLSIYNNIFNIGQVYDSISSGLLDHAPLDKFRETFDVEEADIVLMSGVISSQGTLSVNVSNIGLDLSNLSEISKLAGNIDRKHRIVWFDTMGPAINKNKALFASLRDTDVVISPASVPKHPNLFTNAWHIEKSVFHRYERFERVPGSVMMSRDNLMPEVDMVAGVMEVVKQLHVTKAADLTDVITKPLTKYMDRISCEMLSYPKGIVYKASQCEFVLHTHTTLGAEMMGIEAGMAGCQPIYPDTEFYRDIFDKTGVAFYDIDTPVSSLKSIISKGSTFTDKQVAAFREKFSAEDNLPAFWEHVYNLYNPEVSV